MNPVRKKYLTNNPSQTKKLGEILAKEVIKTKPSKRALVIGLEGDLGGGKTTFLQGFAKGLGIKEKTLSPTFVIMRKSKIPGTRFAGAKSKFKKFYHIDCYRVGKPKEILDLGSKEIITNSQNNVAIEWADRVRKIIPKRAIWLTFGFINKNKRKITIWTPTFPPPSR